MLANFVSVIFVEITKIFPSKIKSLLMVLSMATVSNFSLISVEISIRFSNSEIIETILFLNLNFSEHLKSLLLVFFATLFLYNYQRVIAFKNKAMHLQSERHIWIDKQQNLLITLTVISLVICLIIGISIVSKNYMD